MAKNFRDLCISYNAESLDVPFRMLSTQPHGAPWRASATRGSPRPTRFTTLIQAALTINSLLQNELPAARITDARERLDVEIDRPQLR